MDLVALLTKSGIALYPIKKTHCSRLAQVEACIESVEGVIDQGDFGYVEENAHSHFSDDSSDDVLNTRNYHLTLKMSNHHYTSAFCCSS